jgi:hypothetical protein
VIIIILNGEASLNLFNQLVFAVNYCMPTTNISVYAEIKIKFDVQMLSNRVTLKICLNSSVNTKTHLGFVWIPMYPPQHI